MPKKYLNMLIGALAGAMAVIMVPQFGTMLGGLLGKTLTYGGE